MYTSTTADAFLKRIFTPDFIVNTVASKASRLYKLIKKDTSGAGDFLAMLVVVDESAGASSDFTEAQTGALDTTTTFGSKFIIPWFEDNAVQRINGKALRQSRNNDGAWTKLVRFAMDSCLRIAAFRNSIALATQGWGELATVSATSGSTFKPLRPEHIARFYKGMRLVFSTTLNTAVLRSATALTITGIDPNTTIITLSATMASVGATDNDIVFVSGDRENSATPSRLRPAGLPVFLPLQPVTDATISTLYSVVRSTNGRLYGNYVDGTSLSIEQTLITLGQTVASQGNQDGKLVMVVSPNVYTRLAVELGSNKRYSGKDGQFGFSTLLLSVDGIDCAVISDKFFDDAAAYCVDPKEIECTSMGPCPGINNDDGVGNLLRVSDKNAVETRVVSYFNYGMSNPAGAGVALLPLP
jgi:hypothetical protein